jgi:cytochrome c oxidase subunit 3
MTTTSLTDRRRSPGRPPAAAAEATRAQLGVYVFLASDLMLFAPFFAAYYLLRTDVAAWPPEDVTLDTTRAALATAALIASSVTLLIGHRAAAAGDLVRLRVWLLATIALGGTFLVNQLLEYAGLPFHADDHTYGSIYWLLTGLHTLHVTVGLLVLGAIVARTFRVATAEHLATWLDGGGAFWHLVDVVWIGVFTTIWIVR